MSFAVTDGRAVTHRMPRPCVVANLSHYISCHDITDDGRRLVDQARYRRRVVSGELRQPNLEVLVSS